MLDNAGNADVDKKIDSPEAFEETVCLTFDNGNSLAQKKKSTLQ
jgi:hypothetical protein